MRKGAAAPHEGDKAVLNLSVEPAGDLELREPIFPSRPESALVDRDTHGFARPGLRGGLKLDYLAKRQRPSPEGLERRVVDADLPDEVEEGRSSRRRGFRAQDLATNDR